MAGVGAGFWWLGAEESCARDRGARSRAASRERARIGRFNFETLKPEALFFSVRQGWSWVKVVVSGRCGRAGRTERSSDRVGPQREAGLGGVIYGKYVAYAPDFGVERRRQAAGVTRTWG